MAFEIFIARITCRFEHPLPIGRTVQTKVLSERFPEALRRVTCETPAIDCRSCPKTSKCAFAALFVPPPSGEAAGIPYIEDAAMPFAFRPPDRGAVRGQYDVVLAGRAIPYLADIVNAVDFIGRTGLGRERARFTVASCVALDAAFGPRGGEVTSGSPKKLLDHPPLGLDAMVGEVTLASMKMVSLRFVTPPLLRPGNPDLKPKFGLLARRLRDRIRVVGMLHCGGAPDIDLRGLASKADAVGLSVGDGDVLTYTGALRDFIPLLRIGHYLNVGEWCGYGQGWYEVLC